MKKIDFTLTPIGVIESSLSNVQNAPKQGSKGAQEAWIHIDEQFVDGLKNIRTGDDIIVLTWLHLADRSVLSVHPQDNPTNPLTSVFATRSADRPNPVGLHPVRVIEVGTSKIKVGPLEAVDGTPVIDIKPVI